MALNHLMRETLAELERINSDDTRHIDMTLAKKLITELQHVLLTQDDALSIEASLNRAEQCKKLMRLIRSKSPDDFASNPNYKETRAILMHEVGVILQWLRLNWKLDHLRSPLSNLLNNDQFNCTSLFTLDDDAFERSIRVGRNLGAKTAAEIMQGRKNWRDAKTR